MQGWLSRSNISPAETKSQRDLFFSVGNAGLYLNTLAFFSLHDAVTDFQFLVHFLGLRFMVLKLKASHKTDGVKKKNGVR